MPEIIIEIKDKRPRIIGTEKSIVADNSDYTIRFIFDEQWEDSPKTVYFVRSNGYAFAPVQTVGDEVNVPVQSDVGTISRLYVGVQQGDVKTSRACEISLLPAITDYIEDSAVQPDADLWQGVMLRLMELESAKLTPVDKTDGMTQPVGRDESGKLWTEPSGGDVVIEYNDATGELTISARKNGGGGDIPIYDGTYNVIPSANDSQILGTAQKFLEADMTVEKIPYYETDNTSGGTTVYIGSDVTY